ncbi:MAG: type III secretion system translocon subunit SctE [Alphaproteobacteria bacterium GM7ARS4]|nr:type III secretion system translocon subunit SctE [Alphaproteobacteria bacterium GM7ARS4]
MTGVPISTSSSPKNPPAVSPQGASHSHGVNTRPVASSKAVVTIESADAHGGGLSRDVSQFFDLVALEGPNISTEDIISSLRALRQNLSQSRARSEKRSIGIRQQQLDDRHEKNKEAIRAMAAKLRKASKKGLAGKILGWIGASVTLIAATIATVVTAGATAPLLAMAIVGMGMMVLQETGAMDKMVEGLGKGLSEMLKGMGVDAEKAKEIGGYLAVAVVAVALITANIIAAAASGGTASGELATTVLEVTRLVQQVMEASTLAAQGGVDIAAGVDRKDAADARAEQAGIQASLREIGHAQDVSGDDLKRISQFIQKIDEAIAKILAEISSGQDKLIQKMTV